MARKYISAQQVAKTRLEWAGFPVLKTPSEAQGAWIIGIPAESYKRKLRDILGADINIQVIDAEAFIARVEEKV